MASSTYLSTKNPGNYEKNPLKTGQPTLPYYKVDEQERRPDIFGTGGFTQSANRSPDLSRSTSELHTHHYESRTYGHRTSLNQHIQFVTSMAYSQQWPPPRPPVPENTELDETVYDDGDIVLRVTLPDINLPNREFANFLLEQHTEPYGSDREHSNGEHVEEEQSNEEHPEEEHGEEEQSNEEQSNGEYSEGEHSDGENSNGEHVEEEHAEEDQSNEDQSDGEFSKGEHSEEYHSWRPPTATAMEFLLDLGRQDQTQSSGSPVSAAPPLIPPNRPSSPLSLIPSPSATSRPTSPPLSPPAYATNSFLHALPATSNLPGSPYGSSDPERSPDPDRSPGAFRSPDQIIMATPSTDLRPRFASSPLYLEPFIFRARPDLKPFREIYRGRPQQLQSRRSLIYPPPSPSGASGSTLPSLTRSSPTPPPSTSRLTSPVSESTPPSPTRSSPSQTPSPSTSSRPTSPTSSPPVPEMDESLSPQHPSRLIPPRDWTLQLPWPSTLPTPPLSWIIFGSSRAPTSGRGFEM